MKNKIIKVSIIMIAIIILVNTMAYASIGTLTLKTKTNKDTYNVGDKVTVTVDWTEEMESAGCTLQYDKDKLKFESMSLDIYDASIEGQVSFAWASFDGTKLTKVTYVFTAKAEGETTLAVGNAKGFGTENLEQPDDYKYVSKTITISDLNDTTNNDTNNNTDNNQNGNANQNTNNNDNKTETEKNENNSAGTSISSKKDNTTADGKVPYAGAGTTITTAIVILSIIGTIAFIGYRRLADV